MDNSDVIRILVSRINGVKQELDNLDDFYVKQFRRGLLCAFEECVGLLNLVEEDHVI